MSGSKKGMGKGMMGGGMSSMMPQAMTPPDEELNGPDSEMMMDEEEEPSYSPEAYGTSPYPEEQPSDSPLGLAAIHRMSMESCPNPMDGFQEASCPSDDGHDPYAGPISEASPEDTADFWGSMTDPLQQEGMIKELQSKASKKALASKEFQNFGNKRK